MWPNGPWGALQVDGSLTLTCTVALFADVLPLLLLQPSEIIVAATSRRTKTEIVLRIANYPPHVSGRLGPFQAVARNRRTQKALLMCRQSRFQKGLAVGGTGF